MRKLCGGESPGAAPPPPPPETFADVTVKPWVEYLGVLLGNISSQQAYGPAIAKMMARAKTLCSLPLGMEEKTYLFATWVAPVVFLMAWVHEPTEKVLGQLNLVQCVWHWGSTAGT